MDNLDLETFERCESLSNHLTAQRLDEDVQSLAKELMKEGFEIDDVLGYLKTRINFALQDLTDGE